MPPSATIAPASSPGKVGSATRSATGAAAGAAGTGVRAAGAYTLEHPQTGVSMIGTAVSSATAAGASIAGSAGGALGTAAAIATAPVTILIAGATAAVMGGYEGACYLGDERITDPAEITPILQNLARQFRPRPFCADPLGVRLRGFGR